jgi:DNA polymerase bacteriophage-type
MDKAHLDFETYSDLNLPDVGAFKYSEHESTTAIILGYKIGNGPIKVLDLTDPKSLQGKLLPVYNFIESGGIVCAHNANFEQLIWEMMYDRGFFKIKPKPEQWDCTAARARMIAIPGSLDGAASALGMEIRKDPKGKILMDIFSKPSKEGKRIRREERPEEYLEYMEYCRQDVAVEYELDLILPPLTPVEKECYVMDFKINSRGIGVNLELVEKANKYVEEYSEGLLDRSFEISNCRPTQIQKVMEFLKSQGLEVPNLQATTVEALAQTKGISGEVKELLENRIEISRAGTKKLKSIMTYASDDGRIRGSFLYSAASTRRWSSRGVQIHNLGKPEGETNPEVALEILANDPTDLEIMFNRPLTTIAQSIRGFFQADDQYLIADYSSVEPRGLAWCVQEDWLLEAYKNKEDAYRIAASKVYGVPVKEIAKDSIHRFLGKQLILGCNYGMGPDRFRETCGKFGQNISGEEAFEAVYGYRNSVPKIKQFWYDIENACIEAVLYWKEVKLGVFTLRPETLPNGYKLLFIDMPSGSICYPGPEIGSSEWNGRVKPTFEFYTPLGNSFVKTDTFGGSLTENIIQALTRDILRDGMLKAYKEGFDLCGHVHDEAIAEGRNNKEDLKALEVALCTGSEWAEGFPIETEGFISPIYKK